MGRPLHAGLHADPPISVFFDKSRKCPGRDVARAKKLLADAGLASGYAFEMTVVNNPRERRVAEVIQQMAREVGFNISLRAQEFASALTDDDGKLQAFQIGWSGRVDPDGNSFIIQACKAPLNFAGYCDKDVDAWHMEARSKTEPAERKKIYEKITARFLAEGNMLFLYHPQVLIAYSNRLEDYKPMPDGLVRVVGLKLK